MARLDVWQGGKTGISEMSDTIALSRPGAVATSLAVMIAPLIIIAILDIGPLMGISDNANAIFTLLAALIFVVAHGYVALGPRNIIAFIVITVVVSFASEVIGVATGLVFGAYHYTGLLGPKLLGVPPMIQIGYLATGYASLMTGRIILSLLGPVKGWAILAASLAGTFIMVSWDVAMDPYQSTVTGDWIWHDGGVYFGVPLHNYAGWFGTVFVFMTAYFIFASRWIEQPQKDLMQNEGLFWSLPVLYYALIAIGIVITPLIWSISLPYASPLNYAGPPQALEGSMSLVAIFVMGNPILFALCRLFLGRDRAIS
jgi:putative membrane protein